MLHAARCVSQTRGRKGLRKGPDSWFLEYHLSLPRKFGALNVTNSFDLQTLRHNYSLVQIFAEQCSSRGLGGDSPLPEGPKTRGVRIGHPCYDLSTARKVPKTKTGQRALLAIVPNWVVSGEITAVCTARGG